METIRKYADETAYNDRFLFSRLLSQGSAARCPACPIPGNCLTNEENILLPTYPRICSAFGFYQKQQKYILEDNFLGLDRRDIELLNLDRRPSKVRKYYTLLSTVSIRRVLYPTKTNARQITNVPGTVRIGVRNGKVSREVSVGKEGRRDGPYLASKTKSKVRVVVSRWRTGVGR